MSPMPGHSAHRPTPSHHDLPHHDHEVDRRTLLKSVALGVGFGIVGSLVGAHAAEAATTKVSLPGFDAFASSVKTFRSGKYYLVESTGLPAHDLMVGITNWQQQVPIPQPYTGSNSWKIPVKPVLSANPISARNDLFRGAIALAVNGVPIFNALNNRGEDSYLIGELDEWGGHCGKADDYHYHVAPLHLSKTVGRNKPIAYALDGFPIYGETEPDGKAVTGLDEFNGHLDSKKRYHYHGTRTYPYHNGGMRGVVTVADGQVDPQPRANSGRPPGEPLRGATITAFERSGGAHFELAYTLSGATHRIDYTANMNAVTMTFIDPSGTTSTQTYARRAN